MSQDVSDVRTAVRWLLNQWPEAYVAVHDNRDHLKVPSVC